MQRIIYLILHNLINNEALIRKLSQSYPMRRAAQFLVYLHHKKQCAALEFKKLNELNGIKLSEKLKKIYEELEKQNKNLK